jgi:hypothetical protein
MSHPNSDFLKKFFSKPAVDQRHLPGKHDLSKRLEEYKKKQQKLEESLNKRQKEVVDFSSRIPKKANKLLTEDKQETWVPHITPVGVFYHNKKHGKWMNNFGIVSDTLEGLIEFEEMGLVDTYGDKKSRTQQVIQSFFSDSGSSLALFDSTQNTVDVYSVSYSPTIITSYQYTVNLGNIGFNAQNNQKCLISENGNYLVVSCPESKSVYFFDATSDTLLQTITDDHPNFGSLISMDKDCLGLVISSINTYRDPSNYDTRLNSIGASTQIFYYERNYDSSGQQKFKRIHNQNSYAIMRKTGLERIDDLSVGGVDRSTADQYVDTGVFRVSDIYCKGYEFAVANIALKQDQKNYKTFSYNYDSTRYLSLSEYPNISSLPNLSAQAKIIYVNGPLLSPPLNTDSQEAAVFTMMSLPSVKQFTIVRKIGETYLRDKSYYTPTVSAPILTYRNYATNNFLNPGGLTYFNQNIVGYFAEKSFIRGNGQLQRTGVVNSPSTTNLSPIIEEETLNTKIGINDTHTYHISQILTQSTIKNIRIYRTFNTSADGANSFLYQDYDRSGTTGQASSSPDVLNNGLIKILYNSTDQTSLENSFFNNQTLTSIEKIKLGVVATKPYLTNPGNCPQAEFAYTIDSFGLLNETINKVYVSNNYMFICFDTKTLVLKIDNTKSYKPLIFNTVLNYSLFSYQFSYNGFGEYFLNKNVMYKYNTTSKILENVLNIG